jgi:hypothetical protein
MLILTSDGADTMIGEGMLGPLTVDGSSFDPNAHTLVDEEEEAQSSHV